jgi:hypothetical protein
MFHVNPHLGMLHERAGCVYCAEGGLLVEGEYVRRDPKVLRRVSWILIKEGLHFANLFYIFE